MYSPEHISCSYKKKSIYVIVRQFVNYLEFIVKKSLIFLVSCFMISSVSAANFSGTYECQIHDHIDGNFNAKLVLALNKEASKLKEGYASYDITFDVVGMPYAYTGIAAARGNDLALYFESVGDNKNPDDRGVGIASVIMDQDKLGRDKVSIHKFYYEKSYKGKSNFGFEKCIKMDNA